MNSIIIPCSPKECEQIANGDMTVLVRKVAPKEVPFKAYVYCTKCKDRSLVQEENGYQLYNDKEYFQELYGKYRFANTSNGKIIGEFICERVTEHEICDSGAVVNYWAEGLQHSCLTVNQIDEYVGKRSPADYNKKSKIYGWHISELKIYDEPRELSEFHTICNKYGDDSCGDCPHLAVEQCSYPCDDCVDTWCSVFNLKPIIRPPATYCYVEED